jgi:hypothetical protein
LDSSPRGPTQEEARNVAEKKISPKAPEKAEESTQARTAAARVSKKRLSKKRLSKKRLSK